MIPRVSGCDRRGAHVRACARPRHPLPLPSLPLPSTRTTALALSLLLNLLILRQRRPIWITPTGQHLDGYLDDDIKQFFLSFLLCLVTTFGAEDEFEDMSDDDVALLVPVGESEDGAWGEMEGGVERPGSWAH